MSFYTRLTHLDDVIASTRGVSILLTVSFAVLFWGSLHHSGPVTLIGSLLLGYALANLVMWLKFKRLVAVIGKNLPPGEALAIDLGTGSGVLAVEVASHFPQTRILAIDRHAPGLLQAQERALKAGCSDRVQFFQVDINHLQYQGNPFDAVVALDLFAACSNRDLWVMTLRSACNHLKPGGVFITDICHRTFNRLCAVAGTFLFAVLAWLHWRHGWWLGWLSLPTFLILINVLFGLSLPGGFGRYQWNRGEMESMAKEAGFEGIRFENALPGFPILYVITADKKS